MELTITVYISMINMIKNLELIHYLDRIESEIEADKLISGKKPFTIHHERSEIIPQYAVNVSLRTFYRLLKLNKESRKVAFADNSILEQ